MQTRQSSGSHIVEWLRPICRHVIKFAVRISGVQINILSSKRDFGTLTNTQMSLCKHADWLEPQARAIVTSQCNKSKSRARSNGDFGVSYESSKCSGKQAHLNIRHSAKITCACYKWKFVCQKRRFWQVCTYAKARRGLCNSIRIPCACSIGGLCAIYLSNEGSGESSQCCTGSPKPFVTRQSKTYQTLMLVLVPYMANIYIYIYICTVSSKPSSQYPNLMRWLK